MFGYKAVTKPRGGSDIYNSKVKVSLNPHMEAPRRHGISAYAFA